MTYYVKIEKNAEACVVETIDWEENLALVKVDSESHKVSLYNLVMQTSLLEKKPFDEVSKALTDDF